MSTFVRRRLTCTGCGRRFAAALLEGIHITRLPDVRKQLLEGSFQHFTCPHCKKPHHIQNSAVYTDFERGHYIAVEPELAWGVSVQRAHHQRVFAQSFDQGPPIAQELAQRFSCRLVDGHAALREKLLLWDAGFDDYVVEGLKLDAQREKGLSPGAERWVVSAVLPGDHLLMARLSRVDPEKTAPLHHAPVLLGHETLLQTRYLERLTRRAELLSQWPTLATDWLVDAAYL
ncbi:MAG: CpXC domain-containing protein [Myxococcota bacterium]